MARADAKKEEDPPSQVVAQLHKTSVYLLENVSSEVSATDVRRRQQRGQSIHGLVPRGSRNTFSNRASINEIRILAARRTPGRRSRTRKESRRDHRA